MLRSQENETHNFSYGKTKHAVFYYFAPVFPRLKSWVSFIYASNLQKFYPCVTSIIYIN
jgi:hypothetical protein